MEPKEPACHAQRLNDKLFNATGSLTRIAQDIRNIASAMCALGISAGDDLYRMSEEISENARDAATAHGEHVTRQAEGTLYALIDQP